MEQSVSDDKYAFGRSVAFFQQLADKNLGEVWESYHGNVLALWGKSDFVSTEDDHALIARIVNRKRPGDGEFIALDGVDHGFNKAESKRESYENLTKPANLDPIVIEKTREWIEKIMSGRQDQAQRL